MLGVGDVVLGEFVEDELVVLAQDIGEDVEAAAVGHAHDDLLDAVARAFLDDLVEDRDDGFAALERKALLADVAGVEEFLEQLALEQVARARAFSPRWGACPCAGGLPRCGRAASGGW